MDLNETWNTTPDFNSQHAIEVWTENLSVAQLIQQLARNALSVDGDIEVLRDRLARFMALKKGLEEVPWDENDTDFNFTRHFTQTLGSLAGETLLGNIANDSTVGSADRTVRNDLPTEQREVVQIHREMDDEETLIQWDAAPVVPQEQGVQSSREENSGNSQDRERFPNLTGVSTPNHSVVSLEPGQIENRVRERTLTAVPRTQAGPRVNFALSSTVHANQNPSSVRNLESEINNITYILDEPVPDIGVRNYLERTGSIEKSQGTLNKQPEIAVECNFDRTKRSEYAPPYSLAGVPTRGSQDREYQSNSGSRLESRRRNESVPGTSGISSNRIPEMYDPYQSTVSASFVVGPRKLIRDWKLKFKGGSDSSAEEFLIRIEESRRGTVITDSDLLEALPDLMDGSASLWIRLERDNWKTWNDFVTDFREHFGDPHFQVRVQLEARRRTQGEGEKIIDFVTAYRHVLKYIHPTPPIEDQISMTYNNLRPEYRERFSRRDVQSFRDLENRGKEVEALIQSRQDHRDPPTRDKSYLPELAFDGKGNNNSVKRETSDLAAVSDDRNSDGKSRAGGEGKWVPKWKQRDKRPHNTDRQGGQGAQRGGKSYGAGQRTKWEPRNTKGPAKCFNCGGGGHFARDCPSERRVPKKPETQGQRKEQHADPSLAAITPKPAEN